MTSIVRMFVLTLVQSCSIPPTLFCVSLIVYCGSDLLLWFPWDKWHYLFLDWSTFFSYQHCTMKQILVMHESRCWSELCSPRGWKHLSVRRMNYFLEDAAYFLCFVLELLDCCECISGNNEKVVSTDVGYIWVKQRCAWCWGQRWKQQSWPWICSVWQSRYCKFPIGKLFYYLFIYLFINPNRSWELLILHCLEQWVCLVSVSDCWTEVGPVEKVYFASGAMPSAVNYLLY